MAGALALAAACMAGPGTAQQAFSLGERVDRAALGNGLELRTIDEERLFRESAFGQRVRSAIDAASRALEQENARLLDELTAREQELTELRDTLPPDEFRARADEFDARAERIRSDQAEKLARFQRFEETERRRFFEQTGPVLQDVLAAQGAQVLLDARAIIIGVPGLDMTDAAIDAVDRRIGDGAPAPFPLDAP